jgi:4-amino-4-deoxy-L-arabinose transferase-like glycosyltransferase
MLTDARCTPKHPGKNLSPPRQATPVLLALALAVWVAAVRGPFLGAGPINHDDALYWVIGDAWRHGAPPYTRFWDLKPPGLFLLYRVAATVFGARPEGIRIIAMIAVWVTSLAIWRLGEVRFRDRTAGLVAAALYVPYTVVWYGLASEPELFIAPLVAVSLALTLEALSPKARRVRLRLFGTGLLMGAAMTLKQTAALEALLVVAVIATIGRRSDWLAAFVAGAAAPPLAFLASFAAIGQAPALVSAVVVSVT